MIRYFAIFLALSLIPFALAFGTVEDFSLNKSSYVEGDIIQISGTVQYDPENFPAVIITILPPDGSGFVAVDQKIPDSDGSFSVSFKTGSSWMQEGAYTARVSYGETLEKTFQFSSAKVETTKSNNSSREKPEPEPEPKQTTSKSKELGLAPFVDESKDPQSYVDRYNNEPKYKEWFDENYLQYSSIYEAVGLPEPVKEKIPGWIKNNALWWSEEQIGDDTFVQGIEFMLENNIIVISDVPESKDMPADGIPDWIRNNANWWSQDLISEVEFVNSLKFLIEEGIIIIN